MMVVPPLRERGAGETAWRLCTGPASVLGQNGGSSSEPAAAPAGTGSGLAAGVLHWSAVAAGPVPLAAACSRVALVTLTTARRRLGPMSSTVISTVTRFSPSVV